jgi:CubicO group peptidase (beta-lactamase class C family)
MSTSTGRHRESVTPTAPADTPSWWARQGDLIMRRPFNEWTFTHLNWLLPSEVVTRTGAPAPLPGKSLPLDLTYQFENHEYRLGELHSRTHTTAFLVLHRGRIVHEIYPGAFARRGSRFQLFSVTKSVTSMLFGIAVDEGAIASLDDRVTDYRHDFAGTAYDGPRLADLLDMSSGVGGIEDWTVPNSLIKRFEQAAVGGGSLVDVVRSAPRVGEPGQYFNYSTLDAQVLGWVLEAATGMSLARYAAERLWNRIGAERDAYYWLTRGQPRSALAAGSLNASARDVARLGLLMAHDGELNGRQIVPRDWVRRSQDTTRAHLAVGALGPSGYAHYGYANLWWTLGGKRQAFAGLGVHGQYLYVDPVADVVIVKTSAWPTQDDERRDQETVAALTAVADQFAPASTPREHRTGTPTGTGAQVAG